MREWVEARAKDPIFWNDVLQLCKTAFAATAAWIVAASLLDLPQPFLAPWAALLVVHATVYRTMSRGLQQVAAAIIAVLLASAIGQLIGLSVLGVAVLVLLGLLIGAIKWFGAEATTIAATALIVLTTGFADDRMLIARLLDTGIGIGIGLLVNAAVWPPLRRRTAIIAMDRIDNGIGALLTTIADDISEGCSDDHVSQWIDWSRDLDGELDEAWSLVRQAKESARMNPRQSAKDYRDPKEWYRLLRRMEQSVAEIRSMARTLGGPQAPYRYPWDPSFESRWVPLVHEVGVAATDEDADRLRATRGKLDRLVEEAGPQLAKEPSWPFYGALIINLRNIIDAMDAVAAANPLGQPDWPIRVPIPRRAG